MRASRSSFANACFSGLLTGGLALRVATSCSKPNDSPTPPSVRSGHVASSAPSVRPLASSTAVASALEAPSDPYLTARPVRAKSVGHTSYVLKVTLEGGAVAAFKPRSRLPLGDRRYKGEIAAYRLATALGLDNVPRAIPRSFAAGELGVLEADFAEKARVDDDGRVRGALIPWIDGYQVLPLEDPTQRARWEPWLFDARAVVPDDRRALAASVSTMVAFDYLTANWDRWSGGNVAQDSANGRVLFVDNDGAFYDWPAPATLARQRAELQRVTRFSRRFVEALRALDSTRLRAALGEEAPGVPLVTERSAAGVDARRATVLGIVDARIEDAGPNATLVFE
jgi:hypothetical protein